MKITLNSGIYPLEAIISAAYSFLDRAYVFLDGKPAGGNIIVDLKSKNGKTSKKSSQQLKGEFMNELLFNTLRLKIGKNNKKIREYIIGRALFSPTSDFFDETEGTDKDADYLEDPLGIAVPWEEKYPKKSKKNQV